MNVSNIFLKKNSISPNIFGSIDDPERAPLYPGPQALQVNQLSTTITIPNDLIIKKRSSQEIDRNFMQRQKTKFKAFKEANSKVILNTKYEKLFFVY